MDSNDESRVEVEWMKALRGMQILYRKRLHNMEGILILLLSSSCTIEGAAKMTVHKTYCKDHVSQQLI